MKHFLHYFFCLALSFPLQLAAQPPMHYIEKLSINDGLSNNAVTDVLQDNNGFLWIATKHGLNRYDGTALIHYFAGNDEHSISDNIIYRLLPLDSDHIAIATHHGISVLDTRHYTFKHIVFPSDSIWRPYDNVIYNFEKDKQGNFWAGTPVSLFKLDKSLHIQKVFRADYTPADIGKTRFYYVYEIIPLASGDVFFFLNQRPFYWQHTTGKFINIRNQPSSPFYFLRSTSYFDCSIVYDHYLIYLKRPSDSIFVYNERNGATASCALPEGVSKSNNIDLNFCATGNGWVACTFDVRGVVFVKLQDEKGKLSLFCDRKIYFPDNNFEKWVKDGDGNWWVTTLAEGLLKISPGKQLFNDKDLPHKLPKKLAPAETTCFYKMNKKIFTGTYGDGLYEWDLLSAKLMHHPIKLGAYSEMIWNIRLHNKDTLWLGTQQGLIWYNMRNGKTGTLLQPHPAVLDSFAITTQFTDSRGIIWMGVGAGRGLCTYNIATKKFQIFSNAAGTYPFRYPLSVAEDKAANLWFLNDNTPDLLQWDRATGQFHIVHIPLLSEKTYLPTGMLYMDAKDVLWFGVRSLGLVSYNIHNGNIKTYGIEQGLNTDMIYSINEDKDGRLWLATRQGLTVFDRAKENFVNYQMRDGLPATDCSANLFYDTLTGLMYAGAPGKIIYFSPENFKHLSSHMRVRLTHMMIQNKEMNIPENRKLSLPWKSNDITFAFTGINLANGKENKYAYRLQGANNKWTDVGADRQVRFASLTPGHYIFSVKAARKDGVWSPLTDHIELFIRPPFTHTFWFYLLVILFIAAAIYSWYHYRLMQLMKLEKMRARISHDLHDDIGSRLTNISLMSLVARRESPGDSKTNNWLDKIHQESQEVSKSMREIVWNINPDNDALDEALPRMLHYATDMLEAKGIIVQATIPELNGLQMDMEKRRDLFLIFKEAINNIAHHSHAQNAVIDLKIKNKFFGLHISDDGKGFNSSALPYRNGLQYMQQRATMHQWNFSVKSIPGSGTTLLLEIKLD